MTDEPVIRRAQHSDLPGVHTVHQDCFGNARSSTASDAYINGILARSDGVLLVAQTHREIVGFVVGWAGSGESEVVDLGVQPQRRRQGIARALMRVFLSAATEAGATRCTLEVREDNEAARALYAESGFTEVGRRHRYYADRTDAVVMQIDTA